MKMTMPWLLETCWNRVFRKVQTYCHSKDLEDQYNVYSKASSIENKMQLYHVPKSGRTNCAHQQWSNWKLHWLLDHCKIMTWGPENSPTSKGLQCQWNWKSRRTNYKLCPPIYSVWKPSETSKILCNQPRKRSNYSRISMVGRIQSKYKLERQKTLGNTCPSKNPCSGCKRATKNSHSRNGNQRNSQSHGCTANGGKTH